MAAADLDPQAREVLDALARLAPAVSPDASDAEWLANFRCQAALLRDFSGNAEPVHSVEHVIVVGPVGPLPVRLYRPGAGVLPVLFHVHGGGGIAGSVDGHDPVLRTLANRTGWLVAAPEYRLAPEHRFPIQIEECYAALLAIMARPDVDAERVVVSGDSIGGTIATALAIMARDRGGPALAGQVLFYPNIDLRADADYASRREEDGRIIVAADMERQIRLYIPDSVDRASGPASPINCELQRLPPAFVVTNECDPLRDEGQAFAAALAGADVAVVHRRMPGMIHAFLQLRAHIDATDCLLSEAADWLASL